MQIDEALSKGVRVARNEAGLSRSELAARLAGISEKQIEKVESGEKPMRVSELLEFAHALDTSPVALLYAVDDTYVTPKEKATTEQDMVEVGGTAVKLQEFMAWLLGFDPLPGQRKGYYHEHCERLTHIDRAAGVLRRLDLVEAQMETMFDSLNSLRAEYVNRMGWFSDKIKRAVEIGGPEWLLEEGEQ